MFKKTVLIAAFAGSIALTGCSSETPPPPTFDVSSVEKAKEAPCDRVDDAITEVKKINAAEGNPRGDGLHAWKIEPTASKEEVDKIIGALETRADSEACKSSSEDADPASNPEKCKNDFTVKLDKNFQNKVYSDGVSEDPKVAHQQIADGAKEDPRKLQNIYNASPLGLKDPIENAADIAPLKNGACYTEQGVKWYKAWLVLWDITSLKPDPLPAVGVNTGATPEGNGFQEAGAIPASPGHKVTYVDANGNVVVEHWIRTECGQVVTLTWIVGLPARPDNVPSIVTPPPPEYDECPEPGIQPPGHPCSKADQTGSITAGNHDPQGGRPGPDNPTEPTPRNNEPVIPDRDQPGSSGGGHPTQPPVITPSPDPNPPTEDTGDDDNDGVIPTDPPAESGCDPRFHDNC